jgi:hypothetical protein
MEAMMEIFRKFITPEQRQLALLVEQKGGRAVIDNEQVLKELSDQASKCAPSSMERHRLAKKFDLAEIQNEIDDDPVEAIKRNAEFFNRKFDIQTRLIQEDIERAVNRAGDRIISAVTADPHDRILDPVRLFVEKRIST